MSATPFDATAGSPVLSPSERTTLLETAVDAVHAAESVLESVADGEARVIASLSHDLKLDVDRLCEEAVVRCITDAFPDDSILCEESGLHRGTGGRTWVVDPLDGTVNYAHGLPFYAISVACVSCPPEQLNRQAVQGVEVAVISLPPQEETYCAIRGGGATRNGVPLALRAVPTLEQALVCLGVSAHDGELAFHARLLETLAGRAQKVRSLGALAAELSFVAAGRLDALVQKGTNLWDFIAALLIVQEAGGRITADEFRPGRWQVVAGNPGVFDEVAALVSAT